MFFFYSCQKKNFVLFIRISSVLGEKTGMYMFILMTKTPYTMEIVFALYIRTSKELTLA